MAILRGDVRRRRAAAVCSVVLLTLPGTALAGDRDSHLTATHFIARDLGFNEREAELIAAADYSIDVTAATQPLINRPQISLPTPGAVAQEFTTELLLNRATRDRIVHSLNVSPEAAIEQLERLKAAVETASGDQQLRYMGQYLHALQDANFHQHDVSSLGGLVAEPYNYYWGHLKASWNLGHEVDGVATHFDAAAKAFIATRTTLESFRRARNAGTPVSLPDPKELAIYDTAASALAARTLARNHGADMIRLASAIAKSYDEGDATPQHARLEVNLKRLWADLAPKSPEPLNSAYGPLLKLKGETDVENRDPREGAEKVDYDRDPNLLMEPIRNAVIRTANGRIVADGAATPGGISLSSAAAVGLPIQIDVDAIHYDAARHSVILAGRGTREPQIFDAGMFLTTLRLACSNSDPYFSLDPIDQERYDDELARALADLGQFGDAVVGSLAKPAIATATSTATDGIEIKGPALLSTSLFRQDRRRYDEFLASYPTLRPRLVFRPEWLRGTEVGKILYDADVLLKELAEGLGALDPSQQAAVNRIPKYAPAGLGDAARGLVDALRGTEAAPPNSSQPRGWRLWFDFAGAESTKGRRAILPPPGNVATPPPLIRAADVIEAMLTDSGLLASSGSDGDFRPAELIDVAATRDLSQVLPRMFIRRHEHGVDIPGSDPDLDRVADDVNRRFPVYAAQYPVLRRLVQVFRAYVAGRKIVEADPGACAGLDVSDFPLLPTETLSVPLPAQHPYPLLAIHAAAVKVSYASGQSSQWWERYHYANRYSGGIGFRYDALVRAAPEGGSAVVQRTNALVALRGSDGLIWEDVTPAAGEPQTAIALSLDTSDRADGRDFKPVTASAFLAAIDAELDEVLKKLDMLPNGADATTAASSESDQRLKPYLYGIYVLALIAAVGLAGTGFGIIRLRQARVANALPLSTPSKSLPAPGAVRPSIPSRPPVPSSTAFAGPPHVQFYRRGVPRKLHREAVLNTRPSGNFGTIDASLAAVSFRRDGQNRVAVSIATQLPSALQRGGQRTDLSPQARNSVTILPGDLLQVGDWDIVFGESVNTVRSTSP